MVMALLRAVLKSNGYLIRTTMCFRTQPEPSRFTQGNDPVLDPSCPIRSWNAKTGLGRNPLEPLGALSPSEANSQTSQANDNHGDRGGFRCRDLDHRNVLDAARHGNTLADVRQRQDVVRRAVIDVVEIAATGDVGVPCPIHRAGVQLACRATAARRSCCCAREENWCTQSICRWVERIHLTVTEQDNQTRERIEDSFLRCRYSREERGARSMGGYVVQAQVTRRPFVSSEVVGLVRGTPKHVRYVLIGTQNRTYSSGLKKPSDNGQCRDRPCVVEREYSCV